MRTQTFADHGIYVPATVHGEYRTTCPECSPRRKKATERCLAVNTDRGTWFCHHCAWRGGLSSGNARPYIRPEPPKPDERKREALRQVWGASVPAAHPAAAPLRRYLTNRGLGAVVGHLRSVVRFHVGLSYWQDGQKIGVYPTMLCRVDSPVGNPVSIHRTFLTTDGHKAPVPCPKKLMAPVISGATRGAAIRLYPTTDTLAVAEGVETALAVHITTGLPVWATISAGGMAALVIPEEMRTVQIMADLDRSGAGEEAAHTLCQRLIREGRHASFVLPDGPIPADAKGVDFADALQQHQTLRAK